MLVVAAGNSPENLDRMVATTKTVRSNEVVDSDIFLTLATMLVFISDRIFGSFKKCVKICRKCYVCKYAEISLCKYMYVFVYAITSLVGDSYLNNQCQYRKDLRDTIIVVASSDMLGQLSAYSAFGKDVVSLAAPGEYILVFDAEAENGYCYKYGTSFAAPHVTGALVLLLSAFPNCTVLLLNVHTVLFLSDIHTYTYTVRHFPIV